MKFLLVYLGLGVAVVIGLWVFYRKMGVDRKGLRILWGWTLVGDWGFILVPLLWPLFALLSLLWWLGERLHLSAKRRDALEQAEALKNASEFSHLTMEELLLNRRG